ncbi:MAG: regulatory protein RecX [Candidatus Peribacteria bacterium]|nr:MAG: regulatory protein RecX [Candidatus Peribacteria bacterium]
MPQKKPCIDYAYYYLSRFPKTEKELRAKLYEKGYTDVEVESAMELLIRDGYVDDEQFARMYLESEVIKKGKPLWTIRGKLLQKGIDNRLLE